MSKINVLIIPTHGPARVEEITPDLPTFQRIVGGYIEPISGDGWGAYCNEEGKINGLPVNGLASAIAYIIGWPSEDVLHGTVVFTGPVDADGDETSVPQSVLDAIEGR